MNKKMTPRAIRIIALECIALIIAASVAGAAIITHGKFKATADGNDKSISSSEVNTTNSSSSSPSSSTESKTDNTNPTDSTEASKPDASENQGVHFNSNPSEPNEYAYAGFNPIVTDMNKDISKIIINGDYELPKGYKPTLAEAVKGSDVYLDYRVAPFYQAMYDAAKADGITLTPISGYRSYERQKTNFENRIAQNMNSGMDKKEATVEAAKVIMIPGASEHNAGLAMDICSLSDSFENTEEFAWLSEHAADYGFILRYPKSAEARAITKVVYEPWHYRFVGVDAAKDIKQKGVTLEEYLGLA